MKRFTAWAALAATTILLSASPVMAQSGDYCTLPGEKVVEDPQGDDAAGIGSGHDVEAVYVAEPANLPEKIAVTLKMADLDPVAPPNTIYYVTFLLSDNKTYLFSYDPYTVTEDAFSYGHTEVGAGGVNNLVTDGPADAESEATADGSITWVLTKDKISALPDSLDLSSITGEARLLIGVLGSGLVTSVDDTGGGFYELRGNNSCNGGKSGSGLVAGGLPAGMLLLLALAGLTRRNW